MFDLWNRIPLWFPTFQCAGGKKTQTRLTFFYNLDVSTGIAVNRVSFPLIQLFPALCFSKMIFQVDQHNWFGDVLEPHLVNWSAFKLSSYSSFFPFCFVGLLLSCIFFLVHGTHYAVLQTGVLQSLRGMTLSVRELTRSLNHGLSLCLNPTPMLFIIAMDSGSDLRKQLFAY